MVSLIILLLLFLFMYALRSHFLKLPVSLTNDHYKLLNTACHTLRGHEEAQACLQASV